MFGLGEYRIKYWNIFQMWCMWKMYLFFIFCFWQTIKLFFVVRMSNILIRLKLNFFFSQFILKWWCHSSSVKRENETLGTSFSRLTLLSLFQTGKSLIYMYFWCIWERICGRTQTGFSFLATDGHFIYSTLKKKNLLLMSLCRFA